MTAALWWDDLRVFAEYTTDPIVNPPGTTPEPEMIPFPFDTSTDSSTVGHAALEHPDGWTAYHHVYNGQSLIQLSREEWLMNATPGAAAARSNAPAVIAWKALSVGAGHRYRAVIEVAGGGPADTVVAIGIVQGQMSATPEAAVWSQVGDSYTAIDTPDSTLQPEEPWPELAFTFTATATGLATVFLAYDIRDLALTNPDLTEDGGVRWRNLRIEHYRAGATYYDSASWESIECNVRSARVRHGRKDALSPLEVGTCTLELDDTAGEFAPTIAELSPGTPVRLYARHGRDRHPLFWGFVDTIRHRFEPGDRRPVAIATVECVDLSARLSNLTPPTSYPGTTWDASNAPTAAALWPATGVRVHELLDTVQWPKRVVDTGTVPAWGITGDNNVWDELDRSARADGTLWIDRDGYAVYLEAGNEPAEAGTITAYVHAAEHDAAALTGLDPTLPRLCPRDLSVLESAAQYRNAVAMYRFDTGTSVIRAVDHAAVDTFGWQVLEFDHTSALGATEDTVAAGLLRTDPADALTVSSVTINPYANEDIWTYLLSVWLTWKVQVVYVIGADPAWGFTMDMHVQSVEHVIGAKTWETTLQLDQIDAYTTITP